MRKDGIHHAMGDTHCYRVLPFGLKNAGETYMRAMTTIFHDMIHTEIEVYVDDVIIKSRKQSDHVKDLRKFFQRLRKYNLKLNPTKCTFGVPSGKLLGFKVSRRGIKLDPSKIKAIQELPPPRNKTEVMSLKEQAIYYLSKKFTSYEVKYTHLERTFYALTWVAQKLKHYLSSYTTYVISRLEPLKYIFQKPMPIGRLAKWKILLTEFYIIYVTRTAIKSQALADHLAKNPVDGEYEPLKTYFPDEEVMHINELEQVEKLGWKLFFDGDANMKGVGIGVVLIYEIGHHYPFTAQLHFYCTNNTAEYESCILGLRLAVDMGVQEVLVLGDSDLLVHQIQGEWETRDLKLISYRQYLQDLCQRFRSVEFRHIPRIHNEVADAFATLASMLHHPDKAYVNHLHIQVYDHHAYCNMVEEELDGEPWFHDIREYIRIGVYLIQATGNQKRSICRLASGFVFGGGVLYKRTPDLGLLRCIDARQATTIITEVHSEVHKQQFQRSQFKCWKSSAYLENKGKAVRLKGVQQSGAHLKNEGKRQFECCISCLPGIEEQKKKGNDQLSSTQQTTAAKTDTQQQWSNNAVTAAVSTTRKTQ
ncbi:uncharacterized protein [Nicotiana sylvestris]|uniref:uncharacterized protein n=1 Tax=Nicotiana sylvestris TaxID=4096 RepID=UPI00388CB835